MRITVDRFEGDFAVCEAENGKMYSIPSDLLEGAGEGDVFDILHNAEETENRQDTVKKLLKGLFE